MKFKLQTPCLRKVGELNPPKHSEEAVVEDEAAFEALAQTVMEVPTEIVPAIRELITKHKAA
jgi:hypothetical protein